MQELKELADFTNVREAKLKEKEAELRKQVMLCLTCVWIHMSYFRLIFTFSYSWPALGHPYTYNAHKARAVEKEKRGGQTAAQSNPGKRNEYLARRFIQLKESTHG